MKGPLTVIKPLKQRSKSAITNNMFQIAAKMGVDGMESVSAKLSELFDSGSGQ